MDILDRIKNFFTKLFGMKRSTISAAVEEKEEVHPLEVRMRELLKEKYLKNVNCHPKYCKN
ncbi:MAG: hypothetical protein Q6368_008130 [Candidatus Baldrarchaeota archaeon]